MITLDVKESHNHPRKQGWKAEVGIGRVKGRKNCEKTSGEGRVTNDKDDVFIN